MNKDLEFNFDSLDFYIKQGFKNISQNDFIFILNKLFNITKIDILNNDYKSKIDKEKFKSVITRILNHEPIQYIFNEGYFRDYTFYVDKRVLIPRPETEILVDKVIEIYNKNFRERQVINIVDIGTGSGAISISLANEIKNSKIYSVDISNDALEVAKINTDNYKIKNIEFINGDKLEPFKNKDIKFDILVSNPPYIKYNDYINLDKNVLDYEPKTALLNDDEEGIGFYKYFAENSYKYLNKGGYVVFEIAYHQGAIVSDILKKNGFKNIQLIQDYAKIDRIVSANI